MMEKYSDKQKLKISLGGLTFTAEKIPYVVFDKAVKDTDKAIDLKLCIDITESVKTYPQLRYTTDFAYIK